MSRLWQPLRPRAPFVLPALFLCVACENTRTPSSPQLPPAAPAPVALDWVGTYRGGLVGTREGAELNDPAVVLEIRFDAMPDPLCPACVTVTLSDYFQRAGQRITRPTEASFTYWEDTRRHTLSLGKFSTAGSSGNVLQGTLAIVDTTGGQPIELLAADLLVERNP